MELNKETHTHLFTVFQYQKLISGHYVRCLIVLCRLLANVGVIFYEFVIPLEKIRSQSGVTYAVHRKILVITSKIFCPLLSGYVHS